MDAKEEKAPSWKTTIGSANDFLGCIPSGAVEISNQEQLWVFNHMGGDVYQILNGNADGAPDGKTFLGVNESGDQTSLYKNDDGSGRQRWTLQKIKPGLFYIKNNGVMKNGSYLGSDKGYVKLYKDSEESWLQWELNSIPVVNVYFDLANGLIIETTSDTVAEITLTNKSSVPQSMTFHVTEKVVGSSLFENSSGVSESDGTTFSTGLPCVANGVISTTVPSTVFFTATYGKAENYLTTVTAQYGVHAPLHKKVQCQACISKSTLNVPYTFTLIDGSKETGTWKGIYAWGLHAVTNVSALE